MLLDMSAHSVAPAPLPHATPLDPLDPLNPLPPLSLSRCPIDTQGSFWHRGWSRNHVAVGVKLAIDAKEMTEFRCFFSDVKCARLGNNFLLVLG